MVEFKVLKYKHQRRAQELSEQAEEGTAGNDEVMNFVLSLVASWDFVDAETGEPLSAGPAALDELTLDQYNEVMSLFNRKMGVSPEVPKVNASGSPSGLTESKPAKRSRPKRQNG